MKKDLDAFSVGQKALIFLYYLFPGPRPWWVRGSHRLQVRLPQENREAGLHRHARGRLQVQEEKDRIHACQKGYRRHDRARGRRGKNSTKKIVTVFYVQIIIPSCLFFLPFRLCWKLRSRTSLHSAFMRTLALSETRDSSATTWTALTRSDSSCGSNSTQRNEKKKTLWNRDAWSYYHYSYHAYTTYLCYCALQFYQSVCYMKSKHGIFSITLSGYASFATCGLSSERKKRKHFLRQINCAPDTFPGNSTLPTATKKVRNEMLVHSWEKCVA